MTRIRKSPTMTGAFANVAQEFIQYKRSAGFKYENEPKCLSRFCRFCEEHGVTEIEISRSIAEKWIAPREDESEKSRSHRITCIRQFAIYLNNLILYGCGLRVSEVVSLRYKDVNLEDGILTIREAKTDRDRYIPLSDSVKDACISYADIIWWEKDSDFFFLAPDKTMISPIQCEKHDCDWVYKSQYTTF